jgi:hypothetical protein
MDALVHCSTKFPWLILALAIFYGPTAIMINSYQAEGGWEPKTWGVGFVCHICSMLGCAFWWFFLIPLVLPLASYCFAVYFGYMVMQKSK